jgi:hypothetical protein
MHRVMQSALTACSLALLAGCGGGATVIVTTPVPDAATATPAFAAPASRLRIEAEAAPWSPAMYGSAEQGKMLAAALAAHPSAMIVVGADLDAATWEERIVRAVKASSPATSVVARSRATLDTLMQERGEIPYRVTQEQGGVDAFGQPYYVPREHPLNTEWLLKRKALKGADALVAVRGFAPPPRRLEEMRRSVRGGCGEALDGLSAERERARGYFADLERQADDALAQAFARQLGSALPFLRAEVDERAEAGADPSCAGAYRDLLDRYAPCAKGACPLAPRFSLAAGGIIAMDDGPASAVPPRCAKGAERDYAKEIREAGARAAAETFEAFPSSELDDVLRFAAFDDAVARLGEFCAPRHRRFSPADIASAQEEVRALFESIASSTAHGGIAAASGLERIPGTGPSRVLARILPTGDDPRPAAAELFDRLSGAARCPGGGGDGVLEVAVIDVGTSEVSYLGLFYEEQLACEDLAPAQP